MVRRFKFSEPFSTIFEPYLKNPDPVVIKLKKVDDGLKVAPMNRQNHLLKTENNKADQNLKILSQSQYEKNKFEKNDKIQILRKDDHRGGFGSPELQPGEILDAEGNIIPYDPENPPIDPETGKPMKIVNTNFVKKKGFISIKKMLEMEAAAKKEEESDDDSDEGEKDDEEQKDGDKPEGEDGNDDADKNKDGEDAGDDKGGKYSSFISFFRPFIGQFLG